MGSIMDGHSVAGNTASSAPVKPSDGTGAQVKITGWYTPDRWPHYTGLYTVRVASGHDGLLYVDLFTAFDGSDQWIWLDVFGKVNEEPACRRYKAAQIMMPEELRQDILRNSLLMATAIVATDLADTLCCVNPALNAYVNADRLLQLGYRRDEMSELISEVRAIAAQQGEEWRKPSVARLTRLAGEAEKMWGQRGDQDCVNPRRY